LRASEDDDREVSMRTYDPTALGAALIAVVFPLAAQQSAPPPAFAAPNLTESGTRAMAVNCAACHGTGGNPVAQSTVAGLAGRPKEELVSAMVEFKEGKRPATLMHQIAKGYSEAEIAALADYFSKQPKR
jgi:cytochrome c553